MSRPLRKGFRIPGISDAFCLQKTKQLLQQEYTLLETGEIPSHMILKGRIFTPGISHPIHLEVFTNENVELIASPDIGADTFKALSSRIERLLEQSVDILSRRNTIRVIRARKILEYIQGLSVNNDVERMIIVSLCDIVLDLLVTEKLSQFTSERRILENASVPVKIRALEENIPVYRSRDICNIRVLRNKVAHGGTPTNKEEADWAFKTALDTFEKF